MSTPIPTIAFIGAGNMAQALMGGLLGAGHPVERIVAADPNAAQRSQVADKWGISVLDDNAEAAGQADVIVLAVKPQVMDTVLGSLGDRMDGPLVISIAAGIPLARLEEGLPGGLAIVRAMPNTPALYRAGISGAVGNAAVGPNQRALAETILGSVGPVVWVENEALMDAVTAVSGSGPAYFFLITEAMARAGQDCGLSESVALQLAVHTAAGAGQMMRESPSDPATLRRQVTSPGGTTEAALEAFRLGGLDELVDMAVKAAFERGRALGNATRETE